MTVASRALPSPPSTLSFTPRRGALVLGILVLGAFLLHHAADVRVIEAAMARPFLSVLTGGASHPAGTEFLLFNDYATGHRRGLRVTLDCSSVLVVTPLLLIGGALALVRRFPPGRAAASMAVAGAFMVGVNVARITMVGVATWRFGRDGYELTHRIIGSGLVIVSAVAAFALAFGIASRAADPTRED